MANKNTRSDTIEARGLEDPLLRALLRARDPVSHHLARQLPAIGLAHRPRELWGIPEPFRAEAQDDATLVAIGAQEEAELDIVTDGEIQRENYSNRFATALEGVESGGGAGVEGGVL